MCKTEKKNRVHECSINNLLILFSQVRGNQLLMIINQLTWEMSYYNLHAVQGKVQIRFHRNIPFRLRSNVLIRTTL